MKTFFGALILVSGIVLSYQGYNNSRGLEATGPLARAAACDNGQACKVKETRAHEMRGTATERRYKWRTSTGSATVTCKRAFVFFGAWSCEAVRASIKKAQ